MGFRFSSTLLNRLGFTRGTPSGSGFGRDQNAGTDPCEARAKTLAAELVKERFADVMVVTETLDRVSNRRSTNGRVNARDSCAGYIMRACFEARSMGWTSGAINLIGSGERRLAADFWPGGHDCISTKVCGDTSLPQKIGAKTRGYF
jgi:hypothetical protein